MHRDVIFGKIGIHGSAGCLIRNGAFKKRGTDGENQTAHDLAAGQFRINHLPHIVNGGRAFHSDLSEKIDVHFHEHGAVRKEGKLFAFVFVRFGRELSLDRGGQTRELLFVRPMAKLVQHFLFQLTTRADYRRANTRGQP